MINIFERIKYIAKGIPGLKSTYLFIAHKKIVISYICNNGLLNFIAYRQKNKKACQKELGKIYSIVKHYLKGHYYDFNGAYFPANIEISSDAFFNVFWPHILQLKYNEKEIIKYFDTIEREFSRIILFRKCINNNQIIPSYFLYNYDAHGFTYYLNNVKIAIGDIVLDIGASPGDFASVAIALGADRVHAFESSKYNCNKKLEKVNSLNGNKINIINKRVAEKSTQNTITLDDYLKENALYRCDFIKMDIEGAEVDAIKGAKWIIQNLSPKLAICTYHKKDDYQKIASLIREFNSQYHIINGGGILYGYVSSEKPCE